MLSAVELYDIKAGGGPTDQPVTSQQPVCGIMCATCIACTTCTTCLTTYLDVIIA
ncbi:MAG: hypothetical protein PUE35_08010 [Bacteroidales bacterium]|nr:hypothetical protein [Bacteroidales bacterium]